MGCGCITYPIAWFLATVFLMMLTGLPPTPALIITTVIVIALGLLRLKLGMFSDPYITHETHTQQTQATPQAKPQRTHNYTNFRDIQAMRRIARGQHSVFDHNRQNKFARRIWKNTK